MRFQAASQGRLVHRESTSHLENGGSLLACVRFGGMIAVPDQFLALLLRQMQVQGLGHHNTSWWLLFAGFCSSPHYTLWIRQTSS